MKSYHKALVLGLGHSGEAAARLLRSEGTDVTAIDRADMPALRAQARELESGGARVLLGCTDMPSEPFDVCVVSPGVPLNSPWIAELEKRRVEYFSELELGWIRRRGRVVAVTGSNGKSTAVKWIAESLQQAGLRAAPAGNYGYPVSRAVLEQPDLDWLVLEVSSFQLETVREFRPEVGVLLNIHPNHLDRHPDMETYTRMKARLFSRAAPEDVCLVHESLLDSIRALSAGRGQWKSFGPSAGADYRYAGGCVYRGRAKVADLSGTGFANDVLGVAGAAVMGVMDACGVAPDAAVRAAKAFDPLPHRMQLVGEIGGVKFINDSKATNLSAMAAALKMSSGNVRLIAGGLVKEKDFGFVKELLAQRVLGVYLIGQASEEMASAWSEVVSCFRCGTLDAAVRKAGNDACAGDTVLLSPACASFDQFRNFEERGACFVRAVKDLVEEESRWIKQ